MSEVTHVLNALEKGDPRAAAQLLPLVYEELRRLAAQKLATETPGHTLEATALVHEAYVRLVGSQAQQWDSRGHFFAAAAEAMRRILIENARRKRRLRHGGDRQRVELNDVPCGEPQTDLLALNEALDQLADVEPEVAEVVKLRYFAGLTIEQTASAMNLSVRTTNRHWSFARAWLYRRLHGDNGNNGATKKG
jgi:RNA polymerase sigma factor (TIGR02999 family)